MVYGAAQEEHKSAFLDELSSFCSTNSEPILIGGDFNIIRYANERNKMDGVHRHTLCYTDTSRKARIAYPIRIGHGYVSDTPRIRILRVSDFVLFLLKSDTPTDTYPSSGYGPAH